MAANVIENDGKYLLVKREKGWDLPGGEIAPRGESFQNCAIRKGKEETGYDLEILGCLGHHHHSPREVFKVQDFSAFVYLSKIIGGEKTLSPDLSDIAYFTWDEIQDMGLGFNGELIHPYVLNSIMISRGQPMVGNLVPGNMLNRRTDHLKTYFESI